MPTGRGWLVSAIGLGLGITGRLFGTQALVQLGYALIVLALIALLVVRLGKHEIVASREISPPRVGPGETVTSTIEVTNKGRGAAPLLLLEDLMPKGMSGRARFAIHGIEKGGTRSAGYQIRPHRRGNFQIGPLTISMVDPFGLARVTQRLEATTDLIVHPRTEVLTMPRDPGERRSVNAAASRYPTGITGEDFYTLREYVEGDDLKKIHWASTAKRGRYMIRQEETPWHTRATILFDDRAGMHEGRGNASSFEKTVQAAASLVELYHRSGYGYRVLGALAPPSPLGRGSDHRNRCMDLLALVQPAPGPDEEGSLTSRLIGLDSRGASEAALLVVAGSLTAEDASAIALASRRFRYAAVISFPGHRFSGSSTKERWVAEQSLRAAMDILARSGIKVAALGPDEGIAPAWDALWQPRSQSQESRWGQRPELV